jgi:hypothetical protein
VRLKEYGGGGHVAAYVIAQSDPQHGGARQPGWGLLLSYQWGHTADPPLLKVTPASPEMMQLLRNEHRLIANMVKLQIASEQRQVQ